eukprot:TRINITY_DN4804_c0_g1_i5.p1 TRINITY_DN4804_c0_g1~~TRINITY_DN4804_c0_g1_i5.p1  ORF type:complete len:425 (-),score=88.96 TRINITY_DN4804_c0_g1_i5:34-1308(-)
MAKKRKKKGSKKKEQPPEDTSVPRSFVFRRGRTGRSVASLVKDVRKIMLPYTAVNLQESRRNKLRDFIDVAGPIGVTHFMIFSKSDLGTNLRVIRCPRGPTLTFRVAAYSLMADVVALQKRPHSPGIEFTTPPLVVLNGFGGNEEHKQLMAVMFQNMFPPIDIEKMKLSDCRRVVLLNYDNEKQHVELRHYVIGASPVGLTRSVKKIIKGKIPDLKRYNDMSEYVLGAADLSDSEVEDTPESRVLLPQSYVGPGNRQSQKSAIRLKELGPRMTLQLLKIEEQVCDGRVLYHSHHSKTPEEMTILEKKKAQRAADKAKRRQQQEENVKRKKGEKAGAEEDKETQGDDDDDDDDWYRKEVEEDLDPNSAAPKRGDDDNFGLDDDMGSEDEDEDEGDGEGETKSESDEEEEEAPPPKKSKFKQKKRN